MKHRSDNSVGRMAAIKTRQLLTFIAAQPESVTFETPLDLFICRHRRDGSKHLDRKRSRRVPDPCGLYDTGARCETCRERAAKGISSASGVHNRPHRE